MARTTSLSGFPEWLPEERIVEQHVLDSLRRTFELHGFSSIETRAVETVEQLLRKGEIDKEVYGVSRLQQDEDSSREDALALHPAVREVAVIGIPDEKWGELVTAIVVADGVTAEELIAHTREHLAGYKCPKRIDFVDALPRTATGKIQKFVLRAPFWDALERKVN